jgi:DNA-binding transcriptional MocR family regulator
LFPYDTLEAQIAKPDRWTPSPNAPPRLGAGIGRDTDHSAAAHITVPKITVENDLSKKIDLASALQYGQALGYPPFASFIRQFAREHLHPNVPYEGGPEVIPTIGATDGFNKVVEMIVDAWYPDEHDAADRPHMLCEVFVYPAVLNQTQHKGVRPVPVEIDSEGMLAEGPGGLRDVLENWDHRNGKRPHFMYSVT